MIVAKYICVLKTVDSVIVNCPADNLSRIWLYRVPAFTTTTPQHTLGQCNSDNGTSLSIIMIAQKGWFCYQKIERASMGSWKTIHNSYCRDGLHKWAIVWWDKDGNRITASLRVVVLKGQVMMEWSCLYNRTVTARPRHFYHHDCYAKMVYNSNFFRAAFDYFGRFTYWWCPSPAN